MIQPDDFKVSSEPDAIIRATRVSVGLRVVITFAPDARALGRLTPNQAGVITFAESGVSHEPRR